MKINQWKWAEMSDSQKERLLKRSESGIESVRETVQSIIDRVKAGGDDAIRSLSLQLDHADLSQLPLRLAPEEFDAAEASLSEEMKTAVRFAVSNVERFHRRQRVESLPMEEVLPGVWAGEQATPLDSAAIYIPNGRGSFPSMMYMAAVPAKIAGVKRVVLVSPPNSKGQIDAATLFAARLCGITEAYRIGGAQAIAAMAFGTETIPPCDMVTGPGSKFVTAAKRLLYGTVHVGLPAGPSESIVIADADADPFVTALDLLTEAEHGSDTAALLITPSESLAQAVKAEMEKQVAGLGDTRRQFVSDVLSGFGGILLTRDLAEACDIANQLATEHLQLAVSDPEKWLPRIRHAGEILLGPTPFSASNYVIGPNAILPTGGNAKTYSGVSVRDFIKFSSIMKTTDEGLRLLKPHIETIAAYEGFETHRNALSKRVLP